MPLVHASSFVVLCTAEKRKHFGPLLLSHDQALHLPGNWAHLAQHSAAESHLPEPCEVPADTQVLAFVVLKQAPDTDPAASAAHQTSMIFAHKNTWHSMSAFIAAGIKLR